ncbi:ATRAP-like protein [Mya arenaria]|uniref:ATRAP-like protein n=1 Tax=Mya arenaria TaxID=6604 RepID=A0ABY7F1E3_MYAAR|nr:ATRAP-like protein [Mya arenaria]
MNPPQITLKLLVFFHFVLTVWASQNGFLGLSYVYMNLFVLSLGVWSIVHHESAEPVFMFLICHVFSILQDIILLGINEPRGGSPSHGPYENIDTPPTAPAPTDEEQAYNQPYNSQEKH